MKFKGKFVDIMCKVNPEYEKSVTYEKGNKVLYMQLNPYEQCISNKVIDEHQCIIGWFVDSNKDSHTDDNAKPIIDDNIEEKFGKLSRTTGKKHTFLGMKIEFIGGKKVALSMPHHVDKALEDFGETQKGNVVNPTISQLLTVTNEAKELDDKKGVLSLDNHQNLVDHEAFTARLGNNGVFSIHKGEMNIRGRLGKT